MEQKKKQKPFNARQYAHRQIELRARAALKEKAGQDGHRDPRSKKQLLQEEMKIQAKLRKEEKVAQREQRAAERQAKSAFAKAQAEERMKRDLEWGESHKEDSDEALIAYVKSCAAELGHTPFVREVVGGEYIRSRLVSWPIVLMLTELPFPEGMRPPHQADAGRV